MQLVMAVNFHISIVQEFQRSAPGYLATCEVPTLYDFVLRHEEKMEEGEVFMQSRRGRDHTIYVRMISQSEPYGYIHSQIKRSFISFTAIPSSRKNFLGYSTPSAKQHEHLLS